MPAQVLIQPPPFLDLRQVTLAAVTSIAPQATARAIIQSCRGISFGAVLWISDMPPPVGLPPQTIWHRIEPITTRGAYSQFVVHGLAALVETEHVLLIQWDGYVLDPQQWRPDFLAYDYIGPVWPQFLTMNVGNGGFSLRSRRLLKICAQLPYVDDEAEDLFICRTMRQHLENNHEIKFAPAEIACFFGYERLRSHFNTFGFHGVFNLVELTSDKEAASLLSELPLYSLSSGELRELLIWSFRRKRWRLTLELIKRWRRWSLLVKAKLSFS
ncbi:MAG: DUF5672 family protein [Brevundimonas sp.]|nr:DUF5672 family protein [Brevundimonas sp.]